MNQSTKTFFVIGGSVLIGAVVTFGLGDALVPLLIAFGLAYVSFPLIHGLERRGIRRHYAVVGVFASFASLAVLGLVLVIPILLEDARQFIHELPQTSAVAAEKIESLAGSLGYPLDLSRQGIKEFVVEHASEVSGDFLKSSSHFLRGIFSSFLRGILFILNLFLIPLFFFHLINRYEAISSETKSLIPMSWRPKVVEYTQLTNTILSGYIRGQMMVAILLAGHYGIGFTLIGLRFGLLIGLATGVLSIIPFVGSLMGFAAAIAVALANFTGLGTVIAVVAVFVIIQAIEGLVITPKLVGDKVGLGVLSTMLALIIGGNLFGFVGMIVAIPVAAILKFVLRDLKREYRALPLYRN